MWPRRSPSVRSIGLAAGAFGAAGFVRRRMLRWGATDDELRLVLPGDELLAKANLLSTRAITIAATPAEVWPWIVQLGQGRGGFYSYDRLENLVGARIHNAEMIVPEWQHLSVGDEVKLAPEVALQVARVDAERTVVLRGGVPLGKMPAPYDFTWAFVISEVDDGRTRLVVRERYAYLRWWTGLMVEPTEVVSFLMTQRMLRGIRDRATRSRPANRATAEAHGQHAGPP